MSTVIIFPLKRSVSGPGSGSDIDDGITAYTAAARTRTAIRNPVLFFVSFMGNIPFINYLFLSMKTTASSIEGKTA